MEQVTRLTNLTSGGPVHVDVRDGRIVCTVPLELDESDGPSWTIAARGREFTPPRRTHSPDTAGCLIQVEKWERKSA